MSGWKTYLFVGAGVVTVALHAFGVIDDNTSAALLKVFGFGGLAALRSAISGNEIATAQVQTTVNQTAGVVAAAVEERR